MIAGVGGADGAGPGSKPAGPAERIAGLSRRALGALLRRTGSRGGGFESSRQLLKWLVVGALIGVVAGLGAALFTSAIALATQLFLVAGAGYRPPGPIGEGGAPITAIGRVWALPLVTALGGLISGLIVFGLAPEAEGHGTDAAIDAFHRRGGWIRPRIPLVKLVASAITIGTGGSAGREGPAAQISAGFGALLGHAIFKRPQDRRLAVAAGIGAGIGAIFRAPLGGAVLAAEILYLHDIEVEAIIPSLIASIVAYTVYGAWFGFTPIFGAHASLALGPPTQLAYYVVLGGVAGSVGLVYTRCFYGVTGLFRRLPAPRFLKPALGGLAVGLLGTAFPEALHTGYGWVQAVMSSEGLLALSPLVLVLLPFAKIVATSLSIGSGGSGGIFGPGMVIGAMVGALLWRLGHALLLPGLPPDPASFVIIGMMALFGGIAHAPLAVMLMVAEMTGTLSLLAPAMIAVAISTAMVGDESIYRAQLRDRGASPFHRARFAVPLFSTLHVADAVEPVAATLDHDLSISAALAVLARERATVAGVVSDGALVGTVSRDALERVRPDERSAPVSIVMTRVALEVDQSLDDGMQVLVEAGAASAPVFREGSAAGLVTTRSILRAYRRAIAAGQARVGPVVAAAPR